MKTFGTLFSGSGGYDIGPTQVGWHGLWGFELDNRIAQVGRDNGHNTYTANILDIDPFTLPYVDLLHMSPPCPNFSVAKVGGEETQLDIDLATKCAEFIRKLVPEFVTVENVRAYEQSESFKIILRQLSDLGYGYDYKVLNSANYGVPQTRKRLIVIARRDERKPQFPVHTHENMLPGQASMFTKPWVGWYEAIKDLIPGLPEAKLAPWQVKRLGEIGETVMMSQNSRRDEDELRMMPSPSPSPTLTTRDMQKSFAVIVGDQTHYGGEITIDATDPHSTLRSQENGIRLLCSHTLGSYGTNYSTAHGGSPASTVLTTPQQAGLRAITLHKVVAITPRCLARFQTFPDDYALPESKTLATRIIGNAVPCLLARRLVETLT